MFEVIGLGAEFLFDVQGADRISDVVTRLQQFDTQVRTTGQGVVDFNNTLLEFSSAMMNSGAKMLAKGMATTYAAMRGIQYAADWQTEITNATKYMTDTSAEGMKTFNAEISNISKQMGLAKESILDATINYMAAGKTQDVALQLAKNAAFAATVWDMSADEVSASFQAINASMRVNLQDQETFDKYADMINKVADETASSSQDIVRFLADAGASLSQMGNVTIEEAISMISAARYAQIPVGEFSTSVERMLNTYARGADDIFSGLGVSVRDATGQLIPFSAAMSEVAQKWDTLNDAQKQDFGANFAGVHASNLMRYIGAYQEQEKAFAITQDPSRYMGSSQLEFEKVTSTFNFSVNRMKTTVADFMQAFWGTLLPPLTKVINIVNVVFEKISSFFQAHPMLMKFISGFILLSGVLITVGGAFLIITALMTKFAAVLSMGKLFTSFTQGVKGLGIALRSLGGPLKTAIFQLGRLAFTMGIMYLAWKYDLFGIRSSLESFVSNMKHSFGIARELLSEMPLEQFKKRVSELETSNNVWDKLALGMTKFGLIFQGLFDGWNDLELSDSMYEKLKAAGVLDTVTYLLILKMKFTEFFKGVKEGFTGVIEFVNNIIHTVLKPMFDFIRDKIILPLANAILGEDNPITQFFKRSNEAMGDDVLKKWHDFGVVAGGVLAVLLGFAVLGKVGGILGSIGGTIGRVGGLLGLGGRAGAAAGGAAGVTGANAGPFANIMNPVSVLKGMASLAIILGGITLIVAAYGALSTTKGFNAFMTEGTKVLKNLFVGLLPVLPGLAIVGAMTAIAGKISPAKFAKGMLSISIVIAGFTTIITAVGAIMSAKGFKEFMGNGVKTVGTLFKGLVPILPELAIIGAFTAVAGQLSPSAFLKGIAGLAIVIVGFEAIIVAVGAIASIPYFGEFISRGSEILKSMIGGLDIETVGYLAALSAIIVGLGFATPAVVLSGLAGLALVILGFEAIILAVGAIASIPYFSEFISKGGDILVELFGIIGRAAGTIVASFGEAVTSTLPQIATNLAGFAQNLVPFFSAFDGANTSGVGDFLGALGSFLLVMMGDKILSVFFGETSLTGLGEQLATAAPSFTSFFDEAAKFNDAGLQKAPLAFAAIGGMSAYHFKEGGVAQFFTGEMALDKIGEQLAAAGPNLVVFFNAMGSIDDSAFSKGKSAFDVLGGLSMYEFKTGGVAQFFTGSLAFDEIGRQLAAAGPNLRIFFESLSGIDDSAFAKGKSAFDVLGGLSLYEFKTGGVAQFFTGSLAFDEIGRQLASAGPDLASFFTSIQGINESAFEKGRQMFAVLGGLSMYEFKAGGVAQFFTGSLAFDEIGRQLASAGPDLASFFTSIQGIDEGAFGKAERMFAVLGGLSQYEFKEGGVAQFFTGSLAMDSIGKQMASFGVDMVSFFNDAAQFNEDGMRKAQSAFDALSVIDSKNFKSGGLQEIWGGTLTLSDKGSQFVAFAEGFSEFLDYAATFNQTGIANAPAAFQALEIIGQHADKLKSGGIKSLWDGSIDLTNLGSNLESFAAKMTWVYKYLGEANQSGANRAVEMMDLLNTIGWYDWDGVASKNMGGVGDNLITLAEKIKSAYDTLGSMSNVHTVNNVFNTLKELSLTAERFDGLSLLSVGLSLMSFADSVDLVYQKTANMDSAGMSVMYDVLNEFLDIIDAADTTKMYTLSTRMNTIGNSIELLSGDLQLLSDELVAEFGSNLDLVKQLCDELESTTSGMTIPTSIANGIKQRSGEVKTAIEGVFTDCNPIMPGGSSGAFSYYNLIESGKKIVSTMASGINANSSVIKNALQVSFNRASQVLPHSDAPEGPFSTLTASGMSIPETLASGVDKNSDVLARSMASMGADALSSLPQNASIDVDSNVSDLRNIGVRGTLTDIQTQMLDTPMSAQIEQTQNLFDNRTGDYFQVMIVRMDLILAAITEFTKNPTIRLSDDYVTRNVETVQQIQSTIAENNARTEYHLHVDSGAFKAEITLKDGSLEQAEKMRALLLTMFEEDMLPRVFAEMERMNEVTNR